jgi:hypothetical protein
MPLIEVALPGVVPPKVFAVCTVLAIVAVGFVLVEIGFIVRDYRGEGRIVDSEIGGGGQVCMSHHGWEFVVSF